uniref:Ribosomal protein S27a domain-containing protein n=1 Tax=Meloidogyne incognita TaxID=6306 RepID=A0A914M2S2_MELIC
MRVSSDRAGSGPRPEIDDNGQIQRQRIECNSATCGAGIFMAKHKDRHYCGKCHQTLTEKKG